MQAFLDRWIAVIPTPLTAEDRAAGYWWELSMRQVEVSRTLVFDDPRRAGNFFEALVQAKHRDRSPRGGLDCVRRAPGTQAPSRGIRHAHLQLCKQYLKDGRALRIEAVINKPKDLGVLARLRNLPELIAKARRVNQRLLMIERADQSCAICAV